MAAPRDWLGFVHALLDDERGQTMAEYGLVAAVFGVIMIAAVAVLQGNSGSVLSTSANGWVGVAQSPP
ncbi:MAG: hypothetical protein JWO85_3210 [Candidatus Eremiobacteraeota bacterium]|nr:hypothetical protein [Candidatus Eremiobacteraeota bacterium]